jgi:hypothetical protein
MADPIAEPVVFPASIAEADPRGRRYDAAEKEAAFQSWRLTRSLRQAADATGVSVGTLASWHSRESWTARAESEDRERAELVRSQIVGRVVDQVAASIARVVDLRDHAANEKVRLDAATYLLGLAGLSPNAKDGTGLLAARPAPPPHPSFDDRDDTDFSPEAVYARIRARRERWEREERGE